MSQACPISILPIIIERNSYHLMQTLNKNCKTNINELCEDFVTSTSTEVSQITLKQYLHKNIFMGELKQKNFCKCSQQNKKINLAKDKKIGKINGKIIWSDESRFEVFKGDEKRYI